MKCTKDVCKTKETGSWRHRSAKPAIMKDEDAEQDDDILKHYTKEARDKERSVDIRLKNLVRRKEESLKS
jgi:hypothetical protein